MIGKKYFVLYHANCWDGFGAAWAAWKKLGPRAQYIPMNHGDAMPKGLGGREVFLLDFCFPDDQLKKLVKIARRVTVIDHHISRKDSLPLADDYLYDNAHSGAVLSWQYFHPARPTPRLLRYIEDVDLWRFKLPKTRELMAALGTRDFSFSLLDKIERDFRQTKTRESYIKEGLAVLAYQRRVIEKVVSTAEHVIFENIRAFSANTQTLTSEVGNTLLKKRTLAIIWSRKNGKIAVSLRSRGKLDVSKVAAKYGGGGHRHAAGFSLNASRPLPWKIIKKK